MTNLTINNKELCVDDGITIMEAARRNGIEIPSLCHMPGVHSIGACRICVVEVEGVNNLQASCLAVVREGMVVHTNSEVVRKSRKVLYELMMSDHSEDCLRCTRNQSCEFQAVGKQLGVADVDGARFKGERSVYHLDASPSITRDMSKCILCRRCITACSKVQTTNILSAQNRGFSTEIGPAANLPIGSVNCAFCGQCTVVCPVGALKETSSTNKVWEAINNPAVRTVVQVAPAVRVALGEEFGYEPGTPVTGKMAAALRRLGFDDVFDTNFAADLTIMEEGTEFLTRVRDALTGTGAVLPMITSCSPGWIKHVEHTFPSQLAHLSTCKSPHTMLGALVKSYYAEKTGEPPEKFFVVSVMPCTAKKFEIVREEMENDGLRNVDAVITTRELGDMIKSAGIDFDGLPDADFDHPLGMSSGAADIFGMTGGVMEAALRTVYELVTGRELPFDGLHVAPIEGFDQIKEATLTIEGVLPQYSYLEGVPVRVAVTSGLEGANKLMEQVANGESPYHFIEVMGCPGGCIMGGGQPRSDDPEIRSKRLSGILSVDDAKDLRKSHENPYIKAIYEEYLGEPNGHRSHELLHTAYVPRGLYNELTDRTYVLPQRQPAQAKAAAPYASPAGGLAGSVPGGQPKVFELESENRRLKDELKDALETVDILKSVISDLPGR